MLDPAGQSLADGALRELALANLPGAAAIIFDADLRIRFCEGATLVENGPATEQPESASLADLVPLRQRGALTELCLQALAGASPPGFEFRSARDGRDYRLRVEGLRDAGGAICSGVALLVDISADKLADEQRRTLERRLERLHRREAVDQLAADVAHDFNNLLAVVVNYAGFAADALPADSPLQADLAEIRAAAQRGTALTGELQSRARLTTEKRHRTEVPPDSPSAQPAARAPLEQAN